MQNLGAQTKSIMVFSEYYGIFRSGLLQISEEGKAFWCWKLWLLNLNAIKRSRNNKATM